MLRVGQRFFGDDAHKMRIDAVDSENPQHQRNHHHNAVWVLNAAIWSVVWCRRN